MRPALQMVQSSVHVKYFPLTRRRQVVASCAVALLSVTLARHATAQAAAPGLPSDPAALTLEQLLDVEVESVFGASKSIQKSTEAPAVVTVVTANEIERYGWRTLADVLRNVRGFYVTDDRSYSYVGARGFLRPGDYSTRILLTLDGHRINDNVFDQALIDEGFQVDLSAVERIEVVRGASSSLYGSNAFFGVINIVTKTASQSVAAQVSADIGSLGLRGATVALRHTFGNGLGLSLTGTGQRVAGVPTLYYPEYDNPGNNFGVASGRDGSVRKSVFGRLDRAGLTLSAGFNVRDKTVPTGAYQVVFNQPSSLQDVHGLVDAAWRRSLGRGWQGSFRGAFDHYEFTGAYPYYENDDPRAGIVRFTDRATGVWTTGEAQVSRAIAGRHQFTAGVEHRRNSRQDQSLSIDAPPESVWGNDQRSSTTGLYAQDQIQVSRQLIVNLGVRQDHYSQFSDPLKPRLAVIVQPDRRTTVKVVYGDAFRAPNVFESFYIIPGLWKTRPGLGPENMRSVEASVEHYAGRRVRLSGGVFRYRVDSLIDFVTDPQDGLLFFDNVGSATASGIEAEVEAKWPGGLQLRASYTFTRATSVGSGETLTNSPRHLGQGLVSIPLPGSAFVSLDTQVLSGRTSRTGAAVAGYLRPSLTLVGPSMGRRLRLTLKVTNLTNTGFSDPVGDDFAQDTVRQNGRTSRLAAEWRF